MFVTFLPFCQIFYHMLTVIAQLEDQGHTLGIVPNGFSIRTPEGYVLIASRHDTTRIYHVLSNNPRPSHPRQGSHTCGPEVWRSQIDELLPATVPQAPRLLRRCGDSIWLAVEPPPATLGLRPTSLTARGIDNQRRRYEIRRPVMLQIGAIPSRLGMV